MHALDENHTIHYAPLACKQKNYFCPECKSVVRVRAGLHRKPHFYHLSKKRKCRHNGKSKTHLTVQEKIAKELPINDGCLEVPFPSISRIADVVWRSKRIIFEVQCSPISADEILSRNKDYESEGFQVVWIFHDKTFNRWKISEAEKAIQQSPHYFTNMTKEGKGCIYDQCSIIRGGIRKVLSKKYQIQVSSCKRFEQELSPPFPFLKYRSEKWGFYFEGDLWDSYWNTKENFSFLENWESKKSTKKYPLFPYFQRFLTGCHKTVIKFFLESMCD